MVQYKIPNLDERRFRRLALTRTILAFTRKANSTNSLRALAIRLLQPHPY